MDNIPILPCALDAASIGIAFTIVLLGQAQYCRKKLHPIPLLFYGTNSRSFYGSERAHGCLGGAEVEEAFPKIPDADITPKTILIHNNLINIWQCFVDVSFLFFVMENGTVWGNGRKFHKKSRLP